MDDSAALKFWAEGGVRPIHPALVPQDVVQRCKQKMSEFDEQNATLEEKHAHKALMEGFKWFEVKKEETQTDVAQKGLNEMSSAIHDHEDALQMDANEEQSADDVVSIAANEKAQIASAEKVMAAKQFAKGFLLPKNDRRRGEVDGKISNDDSCQGHASIASEKRGAKEAVSGEPGAKGSNAQVQTHQHQGDGNTELKRKEKTKVRKYCKETQEYMSVSEDADSGSDDVSDKKPSVCSSSDIPNKSSSSSKHRSDTYGKHSPTSAHAEVFRHAADVATSDAKFDSDDFISKMPGLPFSVDPTNGRDFERLIEYGGEQVSL